MPNGHSGGFLIGRTDLEQLLHVLPKQSVLGRALAEPFPRPHSWVDVDAAAAIAVLGNFVGTRIWVEEQDHAWYILHLDQEVAKGGEPDTTKWIMVGPESPLFGPLRDRHQHKWRHWVATQWSRVLRRYFS